MEKSEKHCEKMCNENIVISGKQAAVDTPCNAGKRGSLPGERVREEDKAIVKSTSIRRCTSKARNQENETETDSHELTCLKLPEAEKMVRRWLRNFSLASEHTTGYFSEKLILRNPEVPRGSVINHCSAGTYAYGCTKDVRYRSYVRWKFTGIPNPGCGNGSQGQTLGVITKFEIKGGNKFETNLLPNIEIANYNKLY